MTKRSGFTLIEVIVALTLLMLVLLGMTTTTARLGRTASLASRSTAALGLVQERVATVQMDPAYAQLEARYAGVETAIAGFDGFTRSTRFRVRYDSLASGRVLDYKRVTVEVDGPGLDRPISRTVTITRQ